jgi:hypothetical protein
MREEKPIAVKSIQSLVQNMENAGYSSYMITRARDRLGELRSRGVNGLDKFIRKLSTRAADKESYLDILMEGRFAVILARNNFSDITLEDSQKGPDIKAYYGGQTKFFEVTRRRPSGDEWADRDDDICADQDSIQNVLGKIQSKLGQLKDNEINIVVLWSDTINLMSHRLDEAMKYITQESENDPEMYKNLSAVLFTEGGGINMSTLQQFYLFRNHAASKPVLDTLATKIESLNEEEPEKLRREFDELNKAMNRITNRNLR